MSLSISSASIYRPSSEISISNILNYKRRSKLVSYNNTSVNKIDTLKNCYYTLFDLKNTLSDHIVMARKENRNFTKGESSYLNQLIEKSKTEILSAYNIYKNKTGECYGSATKSTLKDKRTENKITKDINNITDVLYLLYNDVLLMQ
jgi:hypothetical protein